MWGRGREVEEQEREAHACAHSHTRTFATHTLLCISALYMSRHPPPLLPTTASYLYLSSLGTGTYLGAPDDMTDEQVLSSILYAATRGWNVIDTGAWVAQLVGWRAQVCVCMRC